MEAGHRQLKASFAWALLYPHHCPGLERAWETEGPSGHTTGNSRGPRKGWSWGYLTWHRRLTPDTRASWLWSSVALVDGAQHQVCQGSVGLAQILPRFPVGGNPKGPWGLAGNPEGPAAALSRACPLATDPLCALGQTDSLLHLVVYFVPTLFYVRNKCYIPVA